MDKMSAGLYGENIQSIHLMLSTRDQKKCAEEDGIPRPSKTCVLAGSYFNRTSLIFLGVLGFLAVFSLVGGLLLFLSFRHIIEFFVAKFLVLEPNTQLFTMWKEPPLPVYMSVYLFNITNRNEFPWHETKPTVEQIGPYVFREYWNRTDVKWFPNGTLSYKKVKTFEMDVNRTVGSLDDVVTSLNVPALSVGRMFKTAGPVVKMMISSMLHFLHESLFVEKKVRQMLFEGYDDPLIKLAADILGTYPFDKFGYFYGRNDTATEEYNVYTGANGNWDKFTVIEKFRNKTNMEVWDGEECNLVRGTDGSSYPPFLDPSRTLQLFAADMCRVLELVYAGTGEFHGIPTYKFDLSPDTFDNGTLNPKNKCYCTGGHCLKAGAFNVSQCTFGAPLALSLPHYYNADPSYLDNIVGLHPNPAQHASFFYLEPTVAFPMNVSAKLQLNAMLERIPHFSFFDQLPEMLFPLVWFEEECRATKWRHKFRFEYTRNRYREFGLCRTIVEGLSCSNYIFELQRTDLQRKGEMTDELVSQLDNMFYKPIAIGRIGAFCLIGVGAVLCIGAVLYFVVARKQRTDSHHFNHNNQNC